MSRRINPTRQIELRQRQEDSVKNYRAVTEEHTKLKILSHWEDKTAKKIEKNTVYRAMDGIQARHDDILVQRRKRLAALLLAEQQEHEVMIANLAETDDQRRERLMQLARELRNKRDDIRQQESQRRRDQLFREESAVLRDAQSRIKLLAVCEERIKQVEEKKDFDQRQAEEDRFFHEQYIDEQRRQTLRAKQDLEAIHARMQATQRELAIQVDGNTRRRQEERELQAKEDAEYIRQIKEGLEADARAEQARRDAQAKIASDTRKMNEELEVIKQSEMEKLHAEEKEELRALLAQIQAESDAERQRKLDAKEDAMRQIKYVEAQMHATAQSETALDRLWNDANDKEWQKRENTWLKEQTKREGLLKNVFDTRSKQVEEKRTAEKSEAQKRLDEHKEMIENIKVLTTQDTSDFRKRRQKAKDVESYIQSQVSKREAEKQAIRDGKKTEMTDAQAVEHGYRDKIAYELTVLEQTKPQNFQGVSLYKKKRGISGMD